MKPPFPGDDPRVWEATDGDGIPENPEGRRIMVVEDDPPIREVLVTTLRLGGFRVVSAPDGPSALSIAKAFKPELVLMDLMLPGIDGWSLTRQFMAEPDLGKPPIIVLSAKVREADRDKALEAGAVEFLPKPCRAAELLRAIRENLPAR
jgi:CheY-like chemotaxis protein